MGVSEETAPAFGAEATTGSSVVRGGLWKMLSNALPQVYALVISVVVFFGAAILGLCWFTTLRTRRHLRAPALAPAVAALGDPAVS